jgi:hypothetical protein
MGRTGDNRELWHQLDNEPTRAYGAFKTFKMLGPRERTIAEAWRRYSENPDAESPPDYMYEWSKSFAWTERAIAWDHHLEIIREQAADQAIAEEAALQATEVEKTRNRFRELMTLGYTRAIEWLEDSEWTRGNLRSGDVIKIIELHLKALESESAAPEQVQVEGDWNEEDVEDPELARIVGIVDAETTPNGTGEYEPTEEEGTPPEA